MVNDWVEDEDDEEGCRREECNPPAMAMQMQNQGGKFCAENRNGKVERSADT